MERKNGWRVRSFGLIVGIDPGLPDFAPKKCWMQARKECFFNVSIRWMTVNCSIQQAIGLTSDDLAKLNKSIHTKCRTGQLPRWGKSARA